MKIISVKKARLTSLGLDDTIWVAQLHHTPMTLIFAGRGEFVHSFKAVVPVVNLTDAQSKHALDSLSLLFKRLYPGWSGAAKWPADSLGAAWNASPLANRTAPKYGDDLIIKKDIDGIVSATFGVPPDIVVYTVTSRRDCVPTVSKGNPFQRLIC
ncbi:MAG TPA: hypothetical protein VNX86_06310 [Rhizomicrobium sp.]|jgi:hypothetical protein|nr:hypothetical protein [Rhizomicrobium sp.]